MVIFDNGIFDNSIFDAAVAGQTDSASSTGALSTTAVSNLPSTFTVNNARQSTAAVVTNTNVSLPVSITVANDVTSTGLVSVVASAQINSNYSETLITAENISTSAALVTNTAANLFSTYSSVNNVTTLATVTAHAVSSVNTAYTVQNSVNTGLDAVVKASANILNTYAETLLTPQNITSNGSLVTRAQATINTAYAETVIGPVNITTNAAVQSFTQSNLLSTYQNSNQRNGSISAVTAISVNLPTSILEDLILPQNINTTGEITTKVTVVGLTEIYEPTTIGWGNPQVLFNEVEDIVNISLTFDQLGRPLVFYQTAGNILKIYWYNPFNETNEIRVISSGHSPVAGFDIIDDPSDQNSDAMIFYVRNDTVYMRIQRESWNTEHNTGVSKAGIKLQSSGMRVDNRFQVIYDYAYTGGGGGGGNNGGGGEENPYDPPILPTDPGLENNIPPVNGKYSYKNNNMYTGFLMAANDVFINPNTDSFNIGMKVVNTGKGQIENVEFNKSKNQYFYMFGADTFTDHGWTLQAVGYYNTISNTTGFLVWCGNQSGSNHRIDLQGFASLLGNWEFRFTPGKLELYLDGEYKGVSYISVPAGFETKMRLTFYGNRYVRAETRFLTGDIPGTGFSFDGTMKDLWIQHPQFGRIDWPCSTVNSASQPSTPSGFPLTLKEHNKNNWVLYKD